MAETVKKTNYHYYAGLQARARSFVVERGGNRLKLTVIKDDRGPEGGRTKYLLTSDQQLEYAASSAVVPEKVGGGSFFPRC